MMSKSLYVVESKNGLIKIGCSHNPASRAAMISAHSPVPCRLVAMWPGTQIDERVFHRRFKGHRSHNEWFRVEGDVADFVCEVRGRGVRTIATWDDCDRSPEHDRKREISARLSALAKARWANPEYRANHLRHLEFRKKRAAAAAAAEARAA